MSIIHKEKEGGPIEHVIDNYAFDVHDLPFTIRDIIQCLFLMSKTMYDFHANNPACNCYAITINIKSEWVMATPMTINHDFNMAVMRNNKNKTPQSEVENLRNSYTIPDKDHILMFLTKGFIVDNFTVQESYHDFLFTEGEPHVLISSEDIESLTHKNPYLE